MVAAGRTNKTEVKIISEFKSFHAALLFHRGVFVGKHKLSFDRTVVHAIVCFSYLPD